MTSMNRLWRGELANVQYHGSHHATQWCLDALANLMSAGTLIRRALLLTHDGLHGFYLDIEDREPIVIRCGFSSGYSGEGPAGLAIALHLFCRFRIDVEEVLVSSILLERLNDCRLSIDDLDFIRNAEFVRPMRTHEYKHDGLLYRGGPSALVRKQFPPSVPWFVLDDRVEDLAIELSRDPDRAAFNAFRRLESLVKIRCGLSSGTFGVDVFRKAFRGSGAILIWPEASPGEVEGRALMFEAAFIAYRNPRAHRDGEVSVSKAYREFYLVNELFLLEAEAVKVQSD